MAAAPVSLGTQIREELSCSICLELFTRPKVLPCQHTFCQDCLQDHAGREGTIQCPNCRQKTRLPPQGVAGLPNNHIIANMCETLQQQTSLSEETLEQPQSENTCSSHPSEGIKLYCKHCQIPICEQCLEETHDDHLTTTIKKAAQQRCSTVQELLSEGRNILESYFDFLKSLREEEETLIDNKKQTHTDILQAYKQKVKELREGRDHLLSEADKNHTKNLDRIQIEKDRFLADINELSAACDQAEQELQQGWVELLSQPTVLTEVVGKYRRRGAPTPVQTQSTFFQPVDTPGPKLGHVMVQSSAPNPTTALPESSNVAARDTDHHNGNRRQREQRVTFSIRGSSATGGISYLPGVTVSDEGEIFIADKWNQRIQVFTLQGTFVRQFQTVVSGEEKIEPHDVAMDGEGNLWVVGKSRYDREFAVQYNKQGKVLRKIDLEASPFGCLRGVAVDIRRNHILITQNAGVTDIQPGKIQVFEPDGTLVRTVGACTTWLGWFASLLWHRIIRMKYPMYITVDGEGNILVSDSMDNCVYVYRDDGQFLFQFGSTGSGEGQLNCPYGICTDRAGNIIVADTGNRRVEKFDKTGKFLRHITTDMKYPQAVAMSTKGQLVITNDNDNSVSIFKNF
ncbi:PREDICTED: tripartite motif-containing protein 3-like [Branchiostoma belcheri]|uniref:RING-type E3 ubiquitin transferase n=1 Tax=Branchiostoma belcheri TaxID=7741 RepID=A0A6P4YGS3_BRABE|nr:PREDICTED: tripartite motif-containing protein 3-like [Branchiostoma belcheri]